MSNDAEFIAGLIAKAPNEKAPQYVKAKLSIKREELIAWLQSKEGDWINADIKVSAKGNWYVQVDSWKPNQGERQESRKPADKPAAGGGSFDPEDDIPFAPLSKRTHW